MPMSDAEPQPADPDPALRREHLGAFIRLRRERLQPQSAGLAGTARRRTPGLRREELAQLCGVSATWITWLEQGRPVAASAAMLARLAQALQLSVAERAYLFELAGRLDHAAPGAQPRPVDAVLRSVRHMTCPAYVLDRRWDVVASNPQAAELFLDWGAAGASPPPNLLWFLFLDPAARKLIHDWDARSHRLVAEFRADCGLQIDSPPLRAQVEALAAESADFARCWGRHDVLAREGGERRFRHPRRGELTFEQITLRPALHGDIKLVMLLPQP